MRFRTFTPLLGVLLSLSGFSATYSATDYTEQLPPASDELRERNLEEEHESNGPEGARGIPMQRMPVKGIAFVLVTFLASGALAWRAAKDSSTSKPTQ